MNLRPTEIAETAAAAAARGLRETPLRRLVAVALAAASVAVVVPGASAQNRAPSASAGASSDGAKLGLDALSDDVLLSELAGRNLPALLNRAFAANNVTPDKQKAVMARVAFANLRGVKETDPRRAELVRNAAAGVGEVLPAMTDPAAIVADATALMRLGVAPEVNLLEYWGENARTQQRLKPVADAVVAMFSRAHELAAAKANNLANAIQGNNQGAIQQWEKADRDANIAEYSKFNSVYYQALARDKADPERAKAAKEAGEYLSQFDVEENPNRNFDRLNIGKLSLLAGGDAGYAAAREKFKAIAESQPANDAQKQWQYEALYSLARLEVEAKNVDAAKAALANLVAWQDKNIAPKDKPGVEAAQQMMQYRIQSLEAELAKSSADKAKANDAAVATLMQLIEKQPALRGIIFEQLIGRLPEQPEYAKLDVLLLDALVDKGRIEALKPKDDKGDEKALAQAVDAARELLNRAKSGSAGGALTPQKVENTTFLLPFMFEKAGRDLEAASAYLDYADKYKANRKNADIALTNAEVKIAELRRANAPAEQVGPVDNRFLALAIAEPFNRKDLAFRYARRLHDTGKYDEAIKYYGQVGEQSPNHTAARYLMMVLLNNKLKTANAGEKPQIVRQIQALADEVAGDSAAAMEKATDPKLKAAFRGRIVGTKILAADLAASTGDPAKVLQLLSGIEEQAKGLDNELSLVSEALRLRIDALSATGKLDAAVADLKKLLENSKGDEGVAIVVELLKKTDQKYDEAEAGGRKDEMRRLAALRAQLTPQLVAWAKGAKPEYRKFVYDYSVADADTQRLAADLSDDPAQQKQLREAALARYKELENQENFNQYRAKLAGKLTPAQLAKVAYDPSVQLGIGRLEFDLGNFQNALNRLGRFQQDGYAKSATMLVDDGGVQVEKDNDLYWEIIYKVIRCNMALGQAESQKAFLRSQFITWRDRVGGQNWKDEFAALRKELLGDWQIPDATNAPATAPTAAR
jgi:hypothetical protein